MKNMIYLKKTDRTKIKGSRSGHSFRLRAFVFGSWCRRILIFLMMASGTLALLFQNLVPLSAEKSTASDAGVSMLKWSASALVSDSSASRKAVEKDETAYFTLLPDGSVSKISIVNYIQTPVAGDYIDYGIYKMVKSLSLNLEPVIDGSEITWSLPASDKGFYYQGTLENADPPFLFRIEYLLNGSPVKASDLVGKSGGVEIRIHADSNADSAAYFKSNYLCQIQVPLSLERASNIDAPGAQAVVVGRTTTLAYIVLPGKSADFTIRFTANVFEMNAVSITALPFAAGNYLGVDPSEVKSGVDQMIQGSDALVAGTKKLKEGLTSLSSGIALLSDSGKLLAKGQNELNAGFDRYQSGIRLLSGNMTQFSQGLAQISDNKTALSEGYALLSGGVGALLDSMSPLLSSLPVEQQALYNQQIAGVKGQLSAYGTAMNSYFDAVSQISDSAKKLADGLAYLSAQGDSLSSGMAEASQGMGKISKGITDLGTKTQGLPGQVEKLVQGQIALTDGIKQAFALLDAFSSSKAQTPVSFVDSSVSVHSVQFVMTIPEQKMASLVTPDDAASVKKTFWQRLIALFTKE